MNVFVIRLSRSYICISYILVESSTEKFKIKFIIEMQSIF